MSYQLKKKTKAMLLNWLVLYSQDEQKTTSHHNKDNQIVN